MQRQRESNNVPKYGFIEMEELYYAYRKSLSEGLLRDHASRLLQTLTKDEIRRSSIHCEKQLKQFDSMDMEKRDECIALEVMNWSRHTVEPPFYITQKDYFKVDSFQPAQEIGSAFLVFN